MDYLHQSLKSRTWICLILTIAYCTTGSSQLTFQNPTLESGTALADGAVYRFDSVTTNVDALVSIVGRSHTDVAITKMDETSLGYLDAWQPIVDGNFYNGPGDCDAAGSKWVDFQIEFVLRGTNNAFPLNDLYATSIDLDGSVYLREGNYVNSHDSYAAEDSVTISFSDDLQAWGDWVTLPGIDTNDRKGMMAHHFLLTSSFNYRTTQEYSGVCDGTFDGSYETRQYAILFRDIGLPLKGLPIVGNQVWYDLDEDGLQDSGEPGMKDVAVILYKDDNLNGVPNPGAGDNPVDTSFTATNGQYLFSNFTPGDYFIVFEDISPGFDITLSNVGGDDTIDSDSLITNVFTVLSTTEDYNIDLGLIYIDTICERNELKFVDPVLVSGTDLQDGAVYKFDSINNSMFAHVTILGRSHPDIDIDSLDKSGIGINNAFQPQIDANFYNAPGDCDAPGTEWVEFLIEFIPIESTTPSPIGDVYMTPLDIDGSDYVREGYIIEDFTGYGQGNPSYLDLSGFLQVTAQDTEYTDIDTISTGMISFYYQQASSIRLKVAPVYTGLCDGSFGSSRNFAIHFRNYCLPITSVPLLGDFVWEDEDRDGVQDPSEHGIDGVKVILYEDSDSDGIAEPTTDTPYDSLVTSRGGRFLFSDFPSGDYFLHFKEIPQGHTLSPVNAGGDDSLDSDSTLTSVITITPGANIRKWDLGLINENDACFAIGQVPQGILMKWDTIGTISQIGSDLGASQVESMALDPNCTAIYAFNADDFGSVNPISGEFSYCNTLGSVNGALGSHNIKDIDGFTVDKATGYFWATERRNSGNDLLIKVNAFTCDFIADAFGPGVDYVEITGSYSDIDDLAINPCSGEVYAIATGGPSDSSQVVILNITDGTTTHVVTLNEEDFEGITFNKECDLFGSTGKSATNTDNSLYFINLSTGSLTYLNTFPAGDIEALACCNDLSDCPRAISNPHVLYFGKK